MGDVVSIPATSSLSHNFSRLDRPECLGQLKKQIPPVVERTFNYATATRAGCWCCCDPLQGSLQNRYRPLSRNPDLHCLWHPSWYPIEQITRYVSCWTSTRLPVGFAAAEATQEFNLLAQTAISLQISIIQVPRNRSPSLCLLSLIVHSDRFFLVYLLLFLPTCPADCLDLVCPRPLPSDKVFIKVLSIMRPTYFSCLFLSFISSLSAYRALVFCGGLACSMTSKPCATLMKMNPFLHGFNGSPIVVGCPLHLPAINVFKSILPLSIFYYFCFRKIRPLCLYHCLACEELKAPKRVPLSHLPLFFIRMVEEFLPPSIYNCIHPPGA